MLEVTFRAGRRLRPECVATDAEITDPGPAPPICGAVARQGVGGGLQDGQGATAGGRVKVAFINQLEDC